MKREKPKLKNFPEDWVPIAGYKNLILIAAYPQQKYALLLFNQRFEPAPHETNAGRRIRPRQLENTAFDVLMGEKLSTLVEDRRYSVVGVFPLSLESDTVYNIPSDGLYALLEALTYFDE